MVRSGSKYRFSLQWNSNTAEKAIAGQVLERLGNKKSEFVVMALMEYIQVHPEVAALGNKVQINIQPTQSKEQIQAMVKELAKTAVEELLANQTIVPAFKADSAVSEGPSQEDINTMLGNIDFFK